jgi:hypothetical protein
MSYPSAPIRVYLLTFSIELAPVLQFLDTRREVLNWYTLSPHTVLIASRSDLKALTGILHIEAPWLFFLLTEVDPLRTNGWQTPQAWDFIGNPKSSGRYE